MDKPRFEEFLGKPLRARSEPARQTHGGDLAQAAHSDDLMISFGVSLHLQIPLRVADDGNDLPCHELEEDLLRSVWDRVEGKLYEEIFSAVGNGCYLSPIQLAKRFLTEMDIGTGKDYKFGFWILDFGFGIGDWMEFRILNFGFWNLDFAVQ